MSRIDFDAIPASTYKLLLIIVTAIWGSTFIMMKDVVGSIEPAWLIGIRFFSAGVILLIALRKHVARFISRKVVSMGVLLGIFDFTAFLFQTIGLQHTTPGINAFLTATYCVIVPFIWWIVARRRPTLINVTTALLALVGIWLVSVSSSDSGLTLGIGEGLTLIGAVMFAVHIVFVSKFSQLGDVLTLTVLQFLTEGACGLLVGAAFETAPTLAAFTPSVVAQLVFLVLFASIFCFGTQNIALAHVPPAQASLFLSLESVFGVIFSVALYGEVLTARLIIGFVVIFIAIAANETLPQMGDRFLKKKQRSSTQ